MTARYFVLAIFLLGVAPKTASLDLLRRATDPNPTLQSYTASAQLTATLHVLVPLHKTYKGAVYYLKPRRKIEFQGISGPLERFKDLASSTPSYDQAASAYTIEPLTDDGSVSTYLLIPKKTDSRVKSVTVTVADTTALISHVQWLYTNGGKLEFDETYSTVGDFRLASQVAIAARFPGYGVDGTLTFADYKPNAPVSPSIFTEPKQP